MLGLFRRKKAPTPDATAPATEAPAGSDELPITPAIPVPPQPAQTQMPEAKAAADPAARTVAPAPAPPAKSGWRARLAGSALGVGLRSLFSDNPELDDDLLEDLETALLTADVGITASTELVEQLRKEIRARAYRDANAMLVDLRRRLRAMLDPVARPLVVDTTRKPFVVLMVGVNGVGKTTSIGKLAHRLHHEGHRVVLAAGDTFRAAAVAQLQTWGDRIGVPVYSQGQGADSASVIFDALQSARARGEQVLIADTAGRLHTQAGLMDELAKVRRVLAKLDPDAPHEVLQTIDATTGQNAVNQVRQFQQAAGVTGLVVTKLDGSAKGGVVFALAREFGLPIRFVGLGEGADDLQPFDPDAFLDGLLPENLGG